MSRRPNSPYSLLYQFIGNSGRCVYCGQTATTIDHFLPLSQCKKHEFGHFLVPACASCNLIAWNRIFENIDDRMFFIHKRLKAKCARLLSTPNEELSWPRVQEKSKLLQRLIWRNRLNPNYVQLAEISLSPHGAGKNFVRETVENADISLNAEQRLLLGGKRKRTRRSYRQVAMGIRVPIAVMEEVNRMKLSAEDVKFYRRMVYEYGSEQAIEILRDSRPSLRETYE